MEKLTQKQVSHIPPLIAYYLKRLPGSKHVLVARHEYKKQILLRGFDRTPKMVVAAGSEGPPLTLRMLNSSKVQHH